MCLRRYAIRHLVGKEEARSEKNGAAKRGAESVETVPAMFHFPSVAAHLPAVLEEPRVHASTASHGHI